MISSPPRHLSPPQLDIQRSNGRIHSALVSGVNLGARSVTVEWFEGGETKGKEVGGGNISGKSLGCIS